MKNFIIVLLQSKRVLASFKGEGNYVVGSDVYTVLDDQKKMIYPNVPETFVVIPYKKDIPEDLRNSNYLYLDGELQKQ